MPICSWPRPCVTHRPRQPWKPPMSVSHTGLNSSLFVRTVKLKDLPWNGWLRLGVHTPPVAAWNPIAGLTDTTGRLLWHIVGDVAFFPAPYSGDWVVNRIADYQALRGSAGGREWAPGSEQR